MKMIELIILFLFYIHTRLTVFSNQCVIRQIIGRLAIVMINTNDDEISKVFEIK